MTPLAVQTWRAFAKINLELRVLGRRDDGYHEIRTVLETVDLCDEIGVSESETFAFTSDEPPSDESNLVMRAVRAFESESGRQVRLRVDLRKRIPAGAGLGGGSADAAVTLIGLNKYYGTPIRDEGVQRLLAGLGADVPFFRLGGRALGVGRGEVLFPLRDEAPDRWFVLICPHIHISTAEAYSWLTQTPESTTILGFCGHFVPELSRALPGPNARLNDFEGPVFRRFPELAEVKSRLLDAGAGFAALSGSGSALFGAFSSESRARTAAARFKGDAGLRLDPIVARSVGRREYSRRMFEASERDSSGVH